MNFKWILILIWLLSFQVSIFAENDVNLVRIKNEIKLRYKNSPAGNFSMPTNHRLNTDEKAIALTFDACGGSGGDGYNADLIDYLISENIPATLFISGIWIDANKESFLKLAHNDLFEIENHGLNHKAASINGKSIYHIQGTKSIDELIAEIELNARKIEKLTGQRPKYYRSAGGWYDELSMKIVKELGFECVNGNSAGFDFKDNISADEIYRNIKMIESPSIIALHMNHAKWHEKEALQKFIPEMKSKGYRFVKLREYGVTGKWFF
jgi:peptidoglycan/xylan/chitin deacetylase (PgdA/CDA1 family)